MIPPIASSSQETERTSPWETVKNIIPAILIMTGTTVMAATSIIATAVAAGAADMAIMAAGMAVAIAEATTAEVLVAAIPAAAAEMVVAAVAVAETEPRELKNPLAKCGQRVLLGKIIESTRHETCIHRL